MPPPTNEQHAKEKKRARRRKQPGSNIVLPEQAAVGSGRVPLLDPAAPDPFVVSAFNPSTSYDKQASDIITNYKTPQAKRLFNIMADDVKKCCEELLVQEKEVNGETRCAIKGVVTSRLKGDEPLETKLTSADGKQFFLGWFEKAVEMGKTQARLLDSPDMGDLAAVRIGLYLPGDVIKVARRLKQDFDVKHPFGTVMDPTRKAAMMRNQDFTRHDRGRFEEGEDPDDATWEHYGYKSWQVVVGWAGNKTQWDEDLQAMARLFSPLKVEIQVGTVVTQAWAEVQHNIIYKQPKDIRVTNTMKRMIDATNGMAITTDIILRELERSYDEAKAEAEARRQRDREQPLWSLLEYCKTDDEIKAKEIIDSGFDLGTKMGISGDTALHTACSFGTSKVALAMLDSLDKEAAARIVRIKDRFNRTALKIAARHQRLAISVVRALLRHCDKDMILTDESGLETPALELACLFGRAEVFRELVAHVGKTDLISTRWVSGSTLLHVSACRGRADMVKELLCSIDVDVLDISLGTALHQACESGHVSVVKELLHHGADITILNIFKQTAHDVAKKNGHVTILDLLEAISRGKLA